VVRAAAGARGGLRRAEMAPKQNGGDRHDYDDQQAQYQ